MRFTNTSNVPSEILKEMIRQAVPPGVSSFDIKFNKTSYSLRGLAYEWHRYNARLRRHVPLVTIKIPSSFGEHPRPIRVSCSRKEVRKQRQQCRGYMPWECYTDHEEIVHVIAHELRHLWQFKGKGKRRKGMVWGARGSASERDADAYGIRITRSWRRR